jgi:hypothetical protein
LARKEEEPLSRWVGIDKHINVSARSQDRSIGLPHRFDVRGEFWGIQNEEPV